MRSRAGWFALGLLAVGLVGCAEQHGGRLAINGTVKLNGQPLNNGIVMFEPLDKQDTAGNAMVSQGAFSIPVANGLKPGRYLLRVTAGDGKTAVNPANPDEPPGPGGGTNIISKELVPAAWNTQSRQEVTVKSDGQNTFEFDIK